MNGASLPLIMRALKDSRAHTRIELAQELGLDKSTVSNVIGRLIAAGIVHETSEGVASPRGGRRPVRLAIQDHRLLAAGIELSAERFRAVVVDNTGVIRLQVSGKNRRPQDPAATLHAAYRNVLQRADAAGLRLFGVGAALPGIVDPRSGTLVRSDSLGVENVRLLANYRNAPRDPPLVVDNDANCCAWGELHGAAANGGARDFLFLLARRTADYFGIGLGIALDGAVYYGRRFGAGEFAAAGYSRGGDSQFAMAMKDLLRVPADTTRARAFLVELLLSMGPLLAALDPARLVLGGELRQLHPVVMDLLIGDLADSYAAETLAETAIVRSRWGNNSVAAGAAGMVFEKLFAPPVRESSPARDRVEWSRVFETLETAT